MAKRKLYSFDDHPEHRAQLGPCAQKWIANALNCEAMTDADRDAMRVAIDGLYRAANLEPPPAHRVVFVRSPIVGAVAASVAAGAWWIRQNPNEARKLFGRAPTERELMVAVAQAARISIDRCVRWLNGERLQPLTYDATRDATRDATADATAGATYDATRDATDDATYDATDDATDGATRDATRDATIFLVRCIAHWWRFRDGGNMWSGWPAYLSFFRHIAKLEIDYTKWQHYEAAAIHAGPRFMHERFCIVSDRPLFVHRDTANRAHCIDGPHIKWRDGVELHHIHGIRVTPRITAGEFGAREVLEQPNAEVRRVMLERYNQGDAGRWLRDIGAEVLHADVDRFGRQRRLLRAELPGDEPFLGIEVTNSTAEPDGTHKIYTHRCDVELRPVEIAGFRAERGRPQELTCQNAIASTYGFYGDEYQPLIET